MVLADCGEKLDLGELLACDDGRIEEGFLDCATRLVRRSERGGKSRVAPLGMTVFLADGLLIVKTI